MDAGVIGTATIRVNADTSSVAEEIEAGLQAAKLDGLKADLRSAEQYAKGLYAVLSKGGLQAGVVSQYEAELQKTIPEIVATRKQIDLLTQAEIKNEVVTQKMTRTTDQVGGRLGQLARRFGPVALGGTLAFQAFNELSQMLKVTGDESFSTEGRLRNLGSELLNGNVLGGIRAVIAESDKLDYAKLLAKTELASDELETFAAYANRAADAVNTNISTHGKYGTAVQVTIDANKEVAASFREDADAAIAFGNAMDIAAGYGDSLAESMNALAAIPSLDNVPAYRNQKTRVPVGPTVKNEIAQTNARARGDLDELLALQKTARDRINKQVENSTLQGEKRDQLLRKQADAEAAVISTQKQIAAESARAQADAAREAERAARERQAQLDKEAAARKKAREEAAQAYRDQRDFELGQIKNAQAAAGLDGVVTQRDINLKIKEINFLKRREADKKLTRAERQAAQADKIAAQAELRELRGETSKGASVEDFYRAAVANFREFGGGSSGIISGQGARGHLAGRMLGVTGSDGVTAGTSATTGGQKFGKPGSIVDPLLQAQRHQTNLQTRQAALLLAESRKQTMYLRVLAKGKTKLGGAADEQRRTSNFVGGA